MAFLFSPPLTPLNSPSLPHFVNSKPSTRHPPRFRRRTPVCTDPSPSPESVRALIVSSAKSEQQKGLLLVRKLNAPDALDLLLLSLQTSSNEFIRSTAVISIGQLDLTSSSVRITAIQSLVHILATDPDYSVRAAAAAGIGYVSNVPPDVIAALAESLERALLEDSEWQVRFSCLASLGNLKLSSSVPVLLKWLSHDNDLLVQAAVGALGDIADHSVVPQLLNLLGCDDMMTRQRLAQTLGMMDACRNEPSVIDALRILSKDQSFAVRDAADEALRKFGCRQSERADPLSDEEKIDLEVANLMGGDETGNADQTANLALRRRLERSFDKQYVNDEDTDPSPLNQSSATDVTTTRFRELVKDLRYGDPSSQTIAAIHLRAFSPPQILEAVSGCDLLNPDTSSQRLRALSITLYARCGHLDKLIHVLKNDPEQNVRSACCDALQDFGENPAAIAACIDAFQSDPHWLVRISAAIVLGTTGKHSPDTERVLIQCLETRGNLGHPQDAVIQRHAVTALGFLGSLAALPAFEKLAADPTTETPVRFRIAAALRGVVSQDSFSLAKMLVKDPDEEVAEMAQSSLDALALHGFE